MFREKFLCTKISFTDLAFGRVKQIETCTMYIPAHVVHLSPYCLKAHRNYNYSRRRSLSPNTKNYNNFIDEVQGRRYTHFIKVKRIVLNRRTSQNIIQVFTLEHCAQS